LSNRHYMMGGEGKCELGGNLMLSPREDLRGKTLAVNLDGTALVLPMTPDAVPPCNGLH